MEAQDIPYLAKFAPLALAVGLVIEGLKKVPKLSTAFGTPWGTVILIFLPMLLGIGGAYIMHLFDEMKDPYIVGICAGGLSSMVYSVVHKTFLSKETPAPPAKPGCDEKVP